MLILELLKLCEEFMSWIVSLRGNMTDYMYFPIYVILIKIKHLSCMQGMYTQYIWQGTDYMNYYASISWLIYIW